MNPPQYRDSFSIDPVSGMVSQIKPVNRLETRRIDIIVRVSRVEHILHKRHSAFFVSLIGILSSDHSYYHNCSSFPFFLFLADCFMNYKITIYLIRRVSQKKNPNYVLLTCITTHLIH